MTETATNWYAEPHATLGDRIEAARTAAGLSPAALAALLGVRGKTVLGWEADRAEPRANRMQMLAGALSVPLVWLLTGEGAGPRDPEAVPPAPATRRALDDLAALRAQALALAAQAGEMERRVRQILQEQAA